MADSTIECEIERNYRFNALVNVLDGTFFWFGSSFIATRTILPLYVSRFSDSKLALGLLSTIAAAGWLVPQLFTANWVQRLPRKKIGVVNVGLFTERLPIVLLALTAWLLARSPTLALVAFFVCFAWHVFGAGIVAVSWQDLIAKIIPLDRRGRFFGLTNFLGMGTGILGAATATWLLTHYDFPTGYVLCFTAAAVFIFISWICIALTREPAQVSQESPVSQWEYLRRLPSILRADLNFRRYLVSQIVSSLGGMAGGFVTVYAVQRWRLSDGQAGAFTTSLLIGQALSNLLFGVLADRKGHKLVLEVATLCGVLSIGLASVAPAPAWFYAVFALSGASVAGFILSGIMIVFEFSTPNLRPTYIGLSNTIIGVVSAIAPIIGGGLAGTIGYQALFAVACIFGAVSLVLLHWTVREPRYKTPAVVQTSGTPETPEL